MTENTSAVEASPVAPAKRTKRAAPKAANTEQKAPGVPTRAPRKAANTDLNGFRKWLGELGMAATPSIHVNGLAHANVVVVVDFGVPLNQPKLGVDQGSELAAKMRKLVQDMAAPKTVNVRISTDSQNGIWWASL